MASSTSTTIEEEQVKKKHKAEGRTNRTITIGEDGYKWSKYGTKFIKGIGMYRSYFKCRNRNCEAKKKVVWPPNEPDRMEITYERAHNHRALVDSENEEAATSANQYNLATQMFGSNT